MEEGAAANIRPVLRCALQATATVLPAPPLRVQPPNMRATHSRLLKAFSAQSPVRRLRAHLIWLPLSGPSSAR